MITGATDGIGLALARSWTLRGAAPILHGRREITDLDPDVFVQGRYVQADLTRVRAPEDVAAFVDRACPEGLDLLVLNAGVGWVGRVAEEPTASIRELCEVNLVAPMRLCRLLLPGLKARRGRIAYVSSVVSELPCPDYAVYGATKAAAEGFFRSLRVELEGEVDVQVIRPGAVRTSMHEKSGADPAAIGWERFPPVEAVAARIDAMLGGPPRWRTVGLGPRVLRGLGRNLPRLVDGVSARKAR